MPFHLGMPTVPGADFAPPSRLEVSREASGKPAQAWQYEPVNARSEQVDGPLLRRTLRWAMVDEYGWPEEVPR